MKFSKKTIIFLGVLLLAGFFIYNSIRDKTPFAEKKPAVGESAPAISLADLSGKMVSLSDFKGKVVLINFWASWCPPCKDEMPGFQRVYMTYEDKGFAVIGIALDNVNLSLVKDMGILFPVVIANDRVKRDYGDISDVPVSFLLGKDGMIIKKHKGVYSESDLRRDVELSFQQPS